MSNNALGQPSPNRTDFSRWSRDGLEQFARHAADENLLLRRQLDLALHEIARWSQIGAIAAAGVQQVQYPSGARGGHMGDIIQDQQDAARQALRDKEEAQRRQDGLRLRGAGQMRQSEHLGGHDSPGGEIRGQGYGDHTPLR
jgi:hypothetical protein